MKKLSLLFLYFGVQGIFAQNQAPVISGFLAYVDLPQQKIVIEYNVGDSENDLMEITLQFSADGGKTYNLSPVNPTGAIGYPIISSAANQITCDLSSVGGSGAFKARLIADDRQPLDIAQLVAQVDSNRLKNDLRFVEGIRHRTTGAAHLQETRDTMRSIFKNLGLYKGEQAFTFSNSTGYNIWGQSSGISTAERSVIIDAHYDTVNNAPGADDNGSGTVGVWEAARILSRYPSKKTLRYIGFDLEEAGLVGSKRYVQSEIPAPEVIEGVFNFEMIGYYSDEPNSQGTPTGFEVLFPSVYNSLIANEFRGDFITNVGNSNSQSLALLYSNSAQEFVPGLKVTTLVVPGNGSIAPDLTRSDHAPFWTANKPALMLTDGAEFRNECYHTASDTAEGKLNFQFMAQVVQATIAAAAQLAECIHGDWAQADFSVPVSTTAPSALCGLRMTTTARMLNVQGGDCMLEAAKVLVFDERGALVFEQGLSIGAGERADLALPLSSGVYFARIIHQDKHQTAKILLH